jgi:hypothetical protein
MTGSAEADQQLARSAGAQKYLLQLPAVPAHGARLPKQHANAKQITPQRRNQQTK